MAAFLNNAAPTLTVAETERRLEVSNYVVKRLLSEGVLKAVKLTGMKDRVLESSVDALLAQWKQAATAV